MGSTSKEISLLDPAFLRRLERLSIAVRKTQLGATRGERRSKRKGAGFEFADYRDYAQGDDIRHIDWNIYSRLDSLCLKLFRLEEDLTAHILVDASASMSFGTPPKIEFAKKLAAALAYVGMKGYDRVVVAELSGRGVRPSSPGRGKASVAKTFSFIETIECSGATDLEKNVRSYLSANRAKGVVALISDFLDTNGHEGILKRLQQSGSDAYAITVLAPEELDPRVSGDLKLTDSETGAAVEVSVSRTLLKKYKNNLDRFLESLRSDCLRRGVGQFTVSSAVAPEKFVLEQLRKGGALR